MIDDLASDQGRSLEQMRTLHNAVAPLGHRLLLTTRDSTAHELDTLSDSTVLSEAQLAVTWAECAQLASLYGSDHEALRSDLQAAGGHIAMTCLLLEAGSREGDGCELELPSMRILFRRAGGQLWDAVDELDLFRVALLGQGDTQDLIALGVTKPHSLLQALSRIPLVRVSKAGKERRQQFAVHSLAEGWLLDELASSRRAVEVDLVFSVCEVLAHRGDFRRIGRILSEYATPYDLQRLLLKHAEAMLEARVVNPLLNAFETLEIRVLMGEPRLLRLWAESLLLSGRPVEAASKARAAIRLMPHAGDGSTTRIDTLIVLAEALKRLDAFRGCEEVADEMTHFLRSGLDKSVGVRAALAVVGIRCNAGHLEAACEVTQHLNGLRTEGYLAPRDESMTIQYMGIIRGLKDGDFIGSVADLSVAASGLDDWLTERLTIRGNLALALVEIGRVGRALPLARYAAASGDDYLASAFRVGAALSAAALGRDEDALRDAKAALDASVVAGCEYDLAVNRVAVAVILRAAGRLDDALAQAERAYERLCVINYMGYRPLAALEVAASLLSLGDIAAARRWVANVESEDGFGVNRYHALRAAMILAECDRIEGDVHRGISRLEAHAEHILSESSNWQMAMYCRAFPGLLGMFAAAVGAERIPVHMLRMVMPEFAERGMRASRDWLERGEWELLGRRCLGDTGFSMLERRQGEPICHVRLFGGLDVVVGDRVVTSRDWKKSKARLMFAMLVARRGREVAREQVLEHLWPDLSEERARNNYYVAWSAMKLALMGQTSRSTKCPYVDNRGGRLRIVADVLRSDIDEFEEALEQARDADAAGDTDTALSAYVRLSTVYRGELLPGDVYDDWFAPLRDHYQREFIDAMMQAAELLLERDDPCEALVYARRALSADPLREDAYQVALRCHIAAGQRSGAIETFLQCRDRLSEDLGLDPSAETMALYQEILVMEDCPRYDDYGLS